MRNLPFVLLLTFIVSVLAASAPSAGTQNIEELRLAAEQGDADAQAKLGVAYFQGEGVPQDRVEAVRWLRRAAEQGHAGAQYSLGLAYSVGEGVPQDFAETVRWFRRAAEQGHADAQARLGTAYFLGEVVAQDRVEAVRWLRRAAEQGHANGQARLGAAYALGLGVLQDYVSAHMWLNLAAARGHEGARDGSRFGSRMTDDARTDRGSGGERASGTGEFGRRRDAGLLKGTAPRPGVPRQPRFEVVGRPSGSASSSSGEHQASVVVHAIVDGDPWRPITGDYVNRPAGGRFTSVYRVWTLPWPMNPTACSFALSASYCSSYRCIASSWAIDWLLDILFAGRKCTVGNGNRGQEMNHLRGLRPLLAVDPACPVSAVGARVGSADRETTSWCRRL